MHHGSYSIFYITSSFWFKAISKVKHKVNNYTKSINFYKIAYQYVLCVQYINHLVIYNISFIDWSSEKQMGGLWSNWNLEKKRGGEASQVAQW